MKQDEGWARSGAPIMDFSFPDSDKMASDFHQLYFLTSLRDGTYSKGYWYEQVQFESMWRPDSRLTVAEYGISTPSMVR